MAVFAFLCWRFVTSSANFGRVRRPTDLETHTVHSEVNGERSVVSFAHESKLRIGRRCMLIYVILDGVQCDLVSLKSPFQVFPLYSESAVLCAVQCGPYNVCFLFCTSPLSLDYPHCRRSLWITFLVSTSNHTYLFYTVLFLIVHPRSVNNAARSRVSLALVQQTFASDGRLPICISRWVCLSRVLGCQTYGLFPLKVFLSLFVSLWSRCTFEQAREAIL